MKFRKIYRLICEDRVDELVKKYPQMVDSINFIREIYYGISEDIRVSNKFGKFFDWYFGSSWDYLKMFSKNGIISSIEKMYKGYLKYNLKLEDFEDYRKMYDYIEDRENVQNLVIDEKLAKKVYEDGEKVVVMPLNFKGSKKYGADTWCISQRESFWYSYMAEGEKLSYFVLYKTKRKIEIEGYEGKNWNVSNVQVDLDGSFYITNTENTVELGIIGERADAILQFMKLDKSIFRSFNDKEVFRLMVDSDESFMEKVAGNIRMFSIGVQVYPEVFKKKGLVTQFLNACRNNNIEVVKEILKDVDFDFDVNVEDTLGNSGFISACFNNSRESISLLLKDSRVDINKQNVETWTGLMYLCKSGRDDTIKEVLKEDRLDINIQKKDGFTAFHLACYNDYVDLIKLFLNDKRVDRNIVDKYGHTAVDSIQIGSVKQKILKYIEEEEEKQRERIL